ncbi:MAG: hypothetical protein H8D94_01275 [Candidatus Pelagibacter sp.]|nr:hypothetical protein [Candidatus Pelagibacter sp.]
MDEELLDMKLETINNYLADIYLQNKSRECLLELLNTKIDMLLSKSEIIESAMPIIEKYLELSGES